MYDGLMNKEMDSENVAVEWKEMRWVGERLEEVGVKTDWLSSLDVHLTLKDPL